MKHYKVVIIGAGTAGLKARQQVAKKTDNYLVIDSGPLGTMCARVGCMPSKVLVSVAKKVHDFNDLYRKNFIQSSEVSVHQQNIMQHVRKERDYFVSGVVKSMDQWKDHFLEARVVKIYKKNLELSSGEKISFDKLILCVGSRPIVPDSFKAMNEKGKFVTSDEIFELKELPKTIGCIGLGPVGLEIAQALSRLGVKVTGFNRSSQLGGLSDPQLVESSFEYFSKEFELFTGEVELKKADQEGVALEVDSEIKNFDLVFLAAGRKSNLDRIEFCDCDPKKENSIFIAGDANSSSDNILHVAAWEGQQIGKTFDKNFDSLLPMRVTFCDPEIAIVGQSYSELKKSNLDVLRAYASFEKQGASRIMSRNIGGIGIYVKKEAPHILLGAEVFGPDAHYFAHLLHREIELGSNAQDLISRTYYHPTTYEILRTCISNLYKVKQSL